jgi:CRISPR/Cas system-associated exonuclease Cas4 (RecB family)
MFELLILVFVLYCVYRMVAFFRQDAGPSTNPLGIKGKLLYADLGRKSKLFTSYRYRIKAKPDFIIQLLNGENAIAEYKDRNGPAYCSDIAQVKASALAVREEIPLQHGFVVTRNGRYPVPLHPDSEQLHSEIAEYIELARRVKGKQLILQYAANPRQCPNCSLRHGCHKFK